MDNATPIEVFFDLRFDIVKLSLAQYFAQLAYEVGEEEQPAECFLLCLIHFICFATAARI